MRRHAPKRRRTVSCSRGFTTGGGEGGEGDGTSGGGGGGGGGVCGAALLSCSVNPAEIGALGGGGGGGGGGDDGGAGCCAPSGAPPIGPRCDQGWRGGGWAGGRRLCRLWQRLLWPRKMRFLRCGGLL
jgi:hypothetical protein